MNSVPIEVHEIYFMPSPYSHILVGLILYLVIRGIGKTLVTYLKKRAIADLLVFTTLTQALLTLFVAYCLSDYFTMLRKAEVVTALVVGDQGNDERTPYQKRRAHRKGNDEAVVTNRYLRYQLDDGTVLRTEIVRPSKRKIVESYTGQRIYLLVVPGEPDLMTLGSGVMIHLWAWVFALLGAIIIRIL